MGHVGIVCQNLCLACYMICPLCQEILSIKADKVYFDCQCCRALVKDRKLLPDTASEKARYEEHRNDVYDAGYREFTRPIWQYILDEYPASAEGLDFGSGTGPVISSVLQEHSYQVAQYDPYFAPNKELLKQQFDYIFACEVIEHFYEPRREFEQLAGMLRDGAELLLMTSIYHEGIPFMNWYYRNDPTHVFIYRKETLEFIANEFDLELTQTGEKLAILKNA